MYCAYFAPGCIRLEAMVEAIRGDIASGSLKEGDFLPSEKVYAGSYRLSNNTVRKGFDSFRENEGFGQLESFEPDSRIYPFLNEALTPSEKPAAEWTGEESMYRPYRFHMYREIIPSLRTFRDLNMPVARLESLYKEAKLYWSGLETEEEAVRRLVQLLAAPAKSDPVNSLYALPPSAKPSTTAESPICRPFVYMRIVGKSDNAAIMQRKCDIQPFRGRIHLM